jgi:Ca2+-binding EF-hand superfamily protein
MRSQMQAKMFAKADANGSGGVDKTELNNFFNSVSQQTGTTVSSAQSDKLFTQMDTNGDGTLSSSELSQGMQSLIQPTNTMDFANGFNASSSGSSSSGSNSSSSNPINALFSKFDTNGDGKLDSTEIKALADQIKSDTGMDVSSKLDQLAKDNGGTITQDQLTASIQQSGPPPGVSGMDSSSGSSTPSGSTDSSTALQTLLEAIQSAVQPNSANSSGSSGSSGMSSEDFAKMVKELYSQFASSMSQSTQGSLSAIA